MLRLRALFIAAMACCPLVSASGEAVVIGVIGDFGVAALGSSSAAVERAVADVIKRWDPAFIVTVGDNNYPDGASSTIDVNVGQFFAEYIHPYSGTYGPGGLTNRFFPALGNHDWVSGGAPSLAYFELPGNERYYSCRQGPVEFFILNSSGDPDGSSSTSAQAQWLRTALAASTARWKLVSLHHPPYSSDAGGAGTPTFRWPFATWGASAVFAGHAHIYARIHTNGIPYFINGLGGAAIEAFGSTTSAAAVRYRSDYGAMRLEATESNLICQFVTRNHTVVDTLVLGTPVTGPIILGPPLDQLVIAGRSASFDVRASGSGALRYQWQRNGANLPSATNRVLSVANVQFAHEGQYRVLVSTGSSTNASRAARLTVARHPVILAQPTNVTTRPGSNVMFSVRADGLGSLSYQWFHRGQLLPGATSSNLHLAGVQLLEHGGAYAARVIDQMGSVTSSVAELTVLMRPEVIVHPVSQSAAVGETIVLSAEAVGTLPLSFGWRLDRRVLTNQIIYGFTSFFTLPNVQTTNAGDYQVGVTNLAGTAVGGLSTAAVVRVVADADADLMADEWETNYLFSPADPSDAALDFDGDGQSNLAEYLAGTDPTSASDRLMLIAEREGNSATVLEFRAVSNKTYVLEYCETLDAGEWDPLITFTAAPTNRNLRVTDQTGPLTQSRFYRMVTPSTQR